MDPAAWNGLVTAILYRVEYRSISARISAADIAGDIIENPLLKLTAQEEHEILSTGLSSGLPLPRIVESNRSEKEALEFLQEIVSTMDDLRPWPTPTFERLPENRLNDFRSVTPLAYTETPVNDLEARLRRVFDHRQDYGEFLLIRLSSKLEIGLLHPFSAESDRTAVVAVNRPVGSSAQEAIRELTESTGLAPESFVVC
ncbi:hypothetical protein [Nocardia paucivorans]|uniref:hypothetical protein n=1 Tax=Nocardia paucivorans TaxID=114259 RepID=UPI00059455D8|nr:hypothetical protein [Nocardia paucivorans]